MLLKEQKIPVKMYTNLHIIMLSEFKNYTSHSPLSKEKKKLVRMKHRVFVLEIVNISQFYDQQFKRICETL